MAQINLTATSLFSEFTVAGLAFALGGSLSSVGGGRLTVVSTTQVRIELSGKTIDLTGAGFTADEFGRLTSGTIEGFTIPPDASSPSAVAGTEFAIDGHDYGMAFFRASQGLPVDFTAFFNAPLTVIGSEVGDLVTGGEGNEDIQGKLGNDRLIGGLGDDTLNGGAGTDSVQLLGGLVTDVNVINLNRTTAQATSEGSDTFISIENMSGSLGRDFITGTKVANLLDGQDRADQLNGGYGNDTLIGGFGNDRLNGGFGNDSCRGDGGFDRITGGSGNDSLNGGVGQDTLTGGDGNDQISGGDASDVLAGSAGRDTLDGGSGADLYLIEQDDGGDLIVEFDNGADQIDLRDYGFTSFQDLAGIATDTQDGLRIDLGNGNFLQIDLFAKAQFDASDVIL